MKNFILVTVFCCFSQIADAQMSPPASASKLKELTISGPVKEVVEYTYFKKLNEENVDTTKKPYKTIMDFDNSGNELSEIKYSPNGTLLSKLSYDYSKKQFVTISQFDYDNKLAHKVLLKYDDKGMLIESDQYTPPIILSTFKTIFKYNEAGNEIETSLYFANGKIATRSTFLYNKKSQKIEEDFKNSMEDGVAKTVFKYDQWGNIIEEEISDSGNFTGGITVIRYSKYDNYGNWQLETYGSKLGMMALSGTVDKRIIKRFIKYF